MTDSEREYMEQFEIEQDAEAQIQILNNDDESLEGMFEQDNEQETVDENEVPYDFFSEEERKKLIEEEQKRIAEEARLEAEEKYSMNNDEEDGDEEESTYTETADEYMTGSMESENTESVSHDADTVIISDDDIIEKETTVNETSPFKEQPKDTFGGGVENVERDSNPPKSDVKVKEKKEIKHYNPRKVVAVLFFVLVLVVGGILLKAMINKKVDKNDGTSEALAQTSQSTKHIPAREPNYMKQQQQEADIKQQEQAQNNIPKVDVNNPFADGNDVNGQPNGQANTNADIQRQQEIQQGQGTGGLRPESGRTDVSQDPVYQQRQAIRQQFIELARQSYLSKPAVEGSWQRSATENVGNTNGGSNNAPANASADPLNAAREALLSAQKAAAEAIHNAASAGEGAGGGGGGGSGNTNKENFFNSSSSGKGYLSNTRTDKISPYTLPAGSMIPCALISGINSDLPGNITASVTENVFDWQSAHVCLIPQGSRLFGTYSSNISFGQKRVQVSWQRLIFPDGSTLSLEGMSGVDRRGYSGLKDKHYGHYGSMIMATLLTTGFTILPAIVEGKLNEDRVNVNYGYGTSAYQTAASAAAQAIGRMGNKFFDKAINRQPTVLVRPGTRFNVQVNADIPFYRKWSVIKR